MDDSDLNLANLSIRIRDGKGVRDGIVYITDECANTLKRYLEIRPSLNINGHAPLFYTDFGNRWERRHLNRMFYYYKTKQVLRNRAVFISLLAILQPR